MFNVADKRCDQCLFSANKIVSDERKDDILKECVDENTHFNCHKATIRGENTCCRGFYDKDPKSSMAMRFAAHLGLVRFVSVEDEK